MQSKEPVLLGYLAKLAAAALVGVVAKWGIHLDPLEVALAIMTLQAPVSLWVRSKVWPEASVARIAATKAQTS